MLCINGGTHPPHPPWPLFVGRGKVAVHPVCLQGKYLVAVTRLALYLTVCNPLETSGVALDEEKI